MSDTLINLLGWLPGYSGFASYGSRVVPGLTGVCVIYDCSLKRFLTLPSSSVQALLPLEALRQSKPHGIRRLLQRYGLIQFTANLNQSLKTLGVDVSALRAVYSPYCDYLYALSSVPQVLTCHDLTPLTFPSSRKAWLYYRTWIPRQLNNASQIVAISQFVADQLISIGTPSNRIEVVHNGIALDPEPLTAPLGADLLLLARHQPNKNVCLALRAVRRLQEEYPGRWQGTLRIVGREGSESASVYRLRRDLPNPEQVELIDSLSPPALEKVKRSSMALISTSLMEGCNYPVLEACSVGLPSLVSRIPVHEELYARSSLLFSVSDEGVELCHQILRLLQEPQLWAQLSHQSRLTALDFPLDRQHREVQAVITQVSR